MDQEHHLLIHRSKYIIWSLQLVVSFYVLSLFISYLPLISFYYSYSYYFSTIFLSLLTCALERKYVFLVCNGIILVFLVGFRNHLDHHHHHYHYPCFDVDVTVNYDHYVLDTIKTPLETSDVGALEDQSHEILENNSLEVEVEEEVEETYEFDGSDFVAEVDNSFDEKKVEEEEERKDDEDEDEDEDEGVDKEIVGSMSSCTDDELNKKFDEFIRKMKEELRLEAKEYQLIPAK